MKKNIFLKLLFLLKGNSTKRYEMTDKITVTIIHKNLSGKFSLLTKRAKAKIGQCQRYKEYEIKPIPTNNFVESIFEINSSLFENQMIRQTPIMGENV